MVEFTTNIMYTLLNETFYSPTNHSLQAESTSIRAFNFYVLGIFGNTLAAFGLIANTLSIIVLRHRRMQSSTSLYLITLAIYDNIILVTMILFFGLPNLYPETPILEDYYFNYNHAVPFGYPIGLAAQMGSIYTCVAFTVERYIAVCKPLHAANMCTKSRAKKAMMLIFLWVVVYNIPRYFHYRIQVHVVAGSNKTQAVPNTTAFGDHQVFKQVYLVYLQLFFMFLIPFCILLVLNTALMRALNRSRFMRQQISTSAQREHNLTVMLIAVIIVFLVCQFPSIIDNILLASVEAFYLRVNTHYLRFYTMCTLMVEVNSAVNFIMYCVFGKKFRMIFLHIFGFKKIHKQLQYRSTLYNTRSNGIRTYDMEVSLV
ncbi:FMRFamide receptor-like [Gigantopelta aegis]|uniref:FMRFamide receptor-like n=1 Tax=Gigantopelta aegis TaxID=1735272 RepID=UPI001B88D4F5|nr:FMRFamide receptor-like [Gigantopelta aegis]